MTRYVSPFKRAHVREVAHTVKAVAGAVAMTFTAIATAAVASGAIEIAIRVGR